MDKKKKTLLAIIVVAAIVVMDQVVKILVKTNMQIGEDIPLIGEWCRLHFIENEGFAFGTHFGGVVGKYILTSIRLVASGLIIWYICRMIKQGVRTSLIMAFALVLAGAMGNLIDSLFYGLIFNESYYSVATLFPPEGGYAPLFLGKVVDMFYFPLFEFDWPNWMPVVGGEHFEFFNAIFNVADSAVTIGVVWLMVEYFLVDSKHSKSTKTGKEDAVK